MAPRGKPPEEYKPWQFKWDGELYNEDDLTLAQMERIERRSGARWHFIDPFHSAVMAVSVMVVMIAARTSKSEEDVEKEVGAQKPDGFFSTYERVNRDVPDYFEDGLPRPAAARSTGSSRGSVKSRGAGRQK
jgi:hypothetical protein